MLNQERGIFKPSLKSHSLLVNPSIKRFSFVSQPFPQDLSQDYVRTQNDTHSMSYPTLNQAQFRYPNKFLSFRAENRKLGHLAEMERDMQNPSSLTVTRFDPILPKFLFKRFITDSQLPQPQIKHISSQIIQQLKVKNIKYPFEVQRMFRETEEKKILYKKSIAKVNPNSMEEENQNFDNQEPSNSYKIAFSAQKLKGLRKIPFFPLMGTDGQIFWSFCIDKIVLWRYRMQDFNSSEVFCILNFESSPAPISAVYATQIQSLIYKHERTILISVAFFDQLQFFSFNIQKYEKEFIFKYDKGEKTEDDFSKYVEKIMVRVNSNFLIEKILIQNIPNHGSAKKYLRPLVIFTDGGVDIEIVDLQNLAAFKSHSQFDLISKRKRKQENKLQNQIIKLLHCRDEHNPFVHYAFVLRKETRDEQVEPKTLAQKIRSLFSKRFQKKEQMVLTIYEWNETELKNDTLWKKIWNPQRVKKIKEISSKDLEMRLKQNFFDFYRLNINNEFVIADISLVNGDGNQKLFQQVICQGCNLKVTFINGTSVLISNFRTLTFVSKVKVNPYIERSISISSCQYHNYRKLLDKGKYLQNYNQVKNKFNLYIYEPTQSQKDPKYSRIDPVVSECNGLTVCEGKILYEDEMQILYDFRESSTRKRIYQLKERRDFHKKNFMIFEKSFITVVETPNIAETFLLIANLHKKYPDFQNKIKEYASSFFADFTEQQRINLIQGIIELLMQIQSSGKVKESKTQSKVTFNELIKGFYAKQKGNSTDQTTYIEEKDMNFEVLENTYAYEMNLNKIDYEHFVEYLLGNDVLAKEKQYLTKMNSSYNGKIFSLKITQDSFQFMMELLVEHGIKEMSERYIKTTNDLMEISNSLSRYLSELVKNSSDQKYLISLFTGMFQIKESFLASALSKFIMGLLQPILNTSYNDFHRNKALNIIIGEKLEEIKNFLQQFLNHCSFKNNKSKIFEETILFCKSIQNSLPKISLLLKLFETLSEVEYYNTSIQANHQIYSNQVTLKNLLFKVGTKEILSKITVESLFSENAILLDEIEEKLPELNDIKYLRFYIGWKKINSKIIENSEVQKLKQPQENSWLFKFFQAEAPKNKSKKNLLLENEEQKLSEFETKQKQEFLSIEKSLSEYSYDDFEKFFIAKNQYNDFANILISKIYYLQMSYLELKNKYNFTEEGYESFSSFSQTQKKHEIQQFHNKQNPLQVKTQIQNSTFNSFLNYEEKVCGHQKYLRTYSLIKFFNQKILIFFDKATSLYKVECQKVSKQLLSNWVPKQVNWNQQKNYQDCSKYEIMIQEVKKLVDLLFSQGSELMKNQISKRLKDDSLLQSFIRKQFNGLASETQHVSEYNTQTNKFSTYQGSNNFLVKNTIVNGGIYDKSEMRREQERRNMYEQKINQQISQQLKGQFIVKNDTSWMRNHNHQSNQAFKSQKF